MARKYSKARLTLTLKVFRDAREHASSEHQRHLRNGYRFRRVNGASQLPQVTTWNNCDDGSSDEYDPETPKKRRHVTARIPNPKRVKHDPQIANNTHTTSADLGTSPILVTLRFRSLEGKIFLNALVGQYGTGYEKRIPDDDDTRRENSQRQSVKTYLEKQDEESGKIDKGMTRSGLRRKIIAPSKAQGSSASSTSGNTKEWDSIPCRYCKSKDHKRSGCDANESKQVEKTNSLNQAATNFHPTPSAPPVGERPIDQLRSIFFDVQALRGIPAIVPGMRRNPIILDSPSPTPSPEPVLKPPKPSEFTLRTAWAHPIDFKHDNKAGSPCHFCYDFRYGIYGYGEVDTKVRRGAGAGQLVETEDSKGHRSRGKEPTRMCVACSLKRLYISRCLTHTLSRFGVPEDVRFKVYIEQLLDKRYPNCPALKVGVYYTCSLCTQPAFWRCVADQSHDRLYRQLSREAGKGRGCGLLLCNSCAGRVQAGRGVLKKTTVQKDSGHDCRRADMAFLFAGSLLHQAYR